MTALRRRTLALRALWWRRGLSIAILFVATVTTGAAALGPLYARAAGESTLRDELTQSSGLTALHFRDQPYGQYLSTSVSRFDRVQARVPGAGAIYGYPTRVPSVSVYVKNASAPAGMPVQTLLLWRPGSCDRLRIVSGHCPSGAGQALISQRTVASGYGWKLGSTVSTSVGATLRVVGTYVPRNPTGSFWAGQNYFDAAPGSGDQQSPVVDAVFVTRTEIAALPASTQGVLMWDFPLDVSAIRLDDVPELRRNTAALLTHTRKAYSGTKYVETSSELDEVLDAAAHQRHLVDVGTLLVTLQLCLLSWLVLFQVIADAVESRGNEIALAKLRGFRPRWTARFTLGEPLLLLLAALPLGLLLGWTACRGFADSVLAPRTPVVLTWGTAAALLAGFAGGALAAVAASYRALTRTVLQQWRRTTARTRSSLASLVLDVAVSLAAVGGLVILRITYRAGSTDDTAALLAPGLLVIAVALLGTRLLPLLTRTLLNPTRASRRIGLFLASRQVVRRPAGLRLAALLAVAIGLATFAVGGEAVASVNRAHRAQAEVGASRTVVVQYQPGVDPVAAVDRADPDGRWAMAAATWLPNGGGSVVGTVLGVESSRLAAVGYAAAGGPSTAGLAASIGASVAPKIVLHGQRLRVQIAASGIRGAPPQVQFAMRTSTRELVFASAATLRAGTHDYSARLNCANGCTFEGIVLNRPISFFGTMSGSALVRQLDQYSNGSWAELHAGLNRPGAWRAGPEYSISTDTIRTTPEGVRDDYHSESGWGGITYAYSPSPLPAAATPGALVKAPPPLQMTDNLGNTATFTVVESVPVLPHVLDNGLVVDLNFLRDQLTDFDYEAHWSVWLGPRAPADALARLRAAGLTLQNSSSTATRITELGRQGPALSLFLLLACAIIGAIVAVGGTAVAISASARRRSFETAALRAVGVRDAALYRGGVIEQLLLLGAAVVLGIPAGAYAARLAMPVIPQFADPTPIALHYVPPWRPITLFAFGFVLLVVLTAMIAARAVLRAARPGRLREAEE